MRVLIAGDIFAFPHGTGATTRVRAFAKGLREAGADVCVMPMYPVHQDREGATNTEARGVYEGAPFIYASGSTIRFDAFMDRRLMPARTMARAARIISETHPPFDAVIFITGHTTLLPLVVGSAVRRRGGVLLYDGCELPFVYERHLARRRVQERLYTPVAFRWLDGVIVISEYLERYFEARMRTSARLIRVPILVDVDRFSSGESASAAGIPAGRRYIAYTGEINPAKGTESLVRAFSTIAPALPDVDLVLTGYGNPQAYLDGVLTLADELGIGSRLHYLGSVPNDQLPDVLRRASVLALPHPHADYSVAAFPTKLGEYLASATPVVATTVGEVGSFIVDGRSAYLVAPGDTMGLARRMAFVLEHEDEAARVGRAGQDIARRYFDLRLHGERLMEFVQGLKEMRTRADG